MEKYLSTLELHLSPVELYLLPPESIFRQWKAVFRTQESIFRPPETIFRHRKGIFRHWEADFYLFTRESKNVETALGNLYEESYTRFIYFASAEKVFLIYLQFSEAAER